MTDNTASFDRFSNRHSVLVLLATLATLALGTGAFVAIEALAMFAVFGYSHRRVLAAYARPPGIANLVTLARLLILVTVVLLFDVMSAQLVFAAFVANVALDVIDGRLARSLDEVTDFGGQFDMEVDALFVLVAGLYFHVVTGIGLWVLIPGLLRYAYRLSVWALARDSFTESRRRYASVLAGVNFVLLCSAVLLADAWQLATLIVSTLLVSISFALSFAELARHVIESPPTQ